MTAVRTTLTSQNNSDAPLGGLTLTAVCFQFLDRRGSVNEREYGSLANFPGTGLINSAFKTRAELHRSQGFWETQSARPRITGPKRMVNIAYMVDSDS